jgi:hypothetical protein
VFFAIPLLILWSNVHGSASVGAGLLFLHGVLQLRHERRRGIILALAAPACLLASPYGPGLVGYYHTMLFGGTLRHYVLEWGPTHLDAGTAPFFAVALLTLYLLGRRGSAVSPFERIALPLFVLLGVLAARNTLWLGLSASVSLPSLFDGVLGAPLALTRGMRRLNAVLSLAAVGFAAFVLSTMLTGPASTLLSGWPSDGAVAAAAAAGPTGRVLADDSHSDWLLWQVPELSGRIAYDVRFELFTQHQLARLQAFRNGLAPNVAAGSTVFTFTDLAAARRLAPSARVVYRSPGFIVAVRP